MHRSPMEDPQPAQRAALATQEAAENRTYRSQIQTGSQGGSRNRLLDEIHTPQPVNRPQATNRLPPTEALSRPFPPAADLLGCDEF